MSEKNDVVELYRQVMQQRCLDISRYFEYEAAKWEKCVKPDNPDYLHQKGMAEGLRNASAYMANMRESICAPGEFSTNPLVSRK